MFIMSNRHLVTHADMTLREHMTYSHSIHSLLDTIIIADCEWYISYRSYGNASGNKVACVDCAIGWFSDGSRPCERCPELTFATKPGSQSW